MKYTSLKMSAIKGIINSYEEDIGGVDDITLEEHINIDNIVCDFIKKICEI